MQKKLLKLTHLKRKQIFRNKDLKMVSILSITTQYLQKIKLNRKLDRKSLKLTTFKNDLFITKHNCSITNITEYQKKISDNITKLKEIWKNNYKDNKM